MANKMKILDAAVEALIAAVVIGLVLAGILWVAYETIF